MTTTETYAIPVRLDFDRRAKAFSAAMAQLDAASTRGLDRVEFDVRLRELVRIRASQLNGCAYCVDMHSKDARAAGETEQRIYSSPVWRETPFFTGRERAALAFTEALTLVASKPRPRRRVLGRCRALQRRRDRGARKPDRGDQCLEHNRRQHASLEGRILRSVTTEVERVAIYDA
jgi:AhpD family alkylhydroperoxidase